MRKTPAEYLALLLLISGCAPSASQTHSVPQPAEPGSAPSTSINPKIKVYSGLHLGTNIIPIGVGEIVLGCNLVSNATGESRSLDVEACKRYIKDAQRTPGPECQILLDGDPAGLEPSLCTLMIANGQIQPEADESGKRAGANADQVLRYYREHFGRNGLDGHDSENTNLIHIGVKLNNAGYVPDLRLMFYGDGDGVHYRDFTFGADVAAHEMTHGVIADTADLKNLAEPGALSEGVADFFAKLVTGPDDWIIGKGIDLEGSNLRDLANPAHFSTEVPDLRGEPVRKPYPAHIRDMAKPPENQACGTENDNCYIHFNLSIPSHVGYLTVQSLGQEKAEKIWYLAITQYFGPLTGFQKAADALLLACRQLYSDTDCTEVASAWKEVGVTPGA